MSDAVQVVRKQAGATIVKRGEQGNVFYMIAAGTVSVTDIKSQRAANNGAVHESARLAKQTLGPGDCFGEMALLTGEPRAATIVAKSSCTLLALSRGDFEQLLGPLKEALDETFIVRALANIAILAKLSDAERHACARLLRTETFAPEAVVIRQGDPGDKFYVIKASERSRRSLPSLRSATPFRSR